MREGVKRQEGNLCPPSVRWRAKQGTSHRPRQRPIAGQKRSKPTSGKGTLPSITFGGGRGNRVRSFGRLRHTAPRVIQQHTHNTPEWQNAAMPPHCTLLSLSLSVSVYVASSEKGHSQDDCCTSSTPGGVRWGQTHQPSHSGKQPLLLIPPRLLTNIFGMGDYFGFFCS